MIMMSSTAVQPLVINVLYIFNKNNHDLCNKDKLKMQID